MNNKPASTHKHFRAAVLAFALSVAMFAVSSVQAFPNLNLMAGTPDIFSDAITVSYTGNASGGTLTASGFAQTLTPPGASFDMNGTFDISAMLDFTAMTASGSLTVGGTIGSLGFNTGTVLTGNLAEFGAVNNAGDPLQFLFNVGAGDAASLFGTEAGVILSQSGSWDFTDNFTVTGALADTFAVPEPGTMALFLLGGTMLASTRRRHSRKI